MAKKGEGKKDRDAKGHFVKGREKTGGRKVGVKNLAPKGNLRDRLREKLEPLIENLDVELEKVQVEEGTAAKLALIEKFMPYFMPKYSAVNISADQDRPLSEEERLKELDGKYTKKMLQIDIKSMVVVDNDKPKDVDIDPDDDPEFDLSQLEAGLAE
ncbi:MAG: hypothetical protein IJQ13_04475 [Prevotella sp.]|nr:hypothetical protein [Prevotella sp.]